MMPCRHGTGATSTRQEKGGVTECLCPCCASAPSPTYLPAFRLETEARYLLTLPLAQRREYLAAKPVQARRAELQAEMTRQWQAARS